MRPLVLVLLPLLTIAARAAAPERFDLVPSVAQGRIVVQGPAAFYTIRDGETWRIEMAETDFVVVVHESATGVAISPAPAPSGDRLYFESNARTPPVAGREDTDVWVMDRVEGKWANPRPLGPPFDSPYTEHAPTVDGSGTICFNSGRPDGVGENDIYCGGLDAPPQVIRAVSSAAEDAGAWLADDGRVMLFTSNRPGGHGGWDLYVSTRTADGWSSPRNLGAPINTSADELWPSWTEGRLYFKRTGGTEPPGYFSVPLSLSR